MFLDRETEYLTNYFQITEQIFAKIKTRENIKSFKNTYNGTNIIWRGIYYEWFMNYEKWFYEMELRNDFDYLNE